MERRSKDVLQIMGAVIFAMMAFIFLAWLFVMQPAITVDTPQDPVREATVIMEVDAPENVRCFVMVSRITNEPEDLSCVTNETPQHLTFGERLPNTSQRLTF